MDVVVGLGSLGLGTTVRGMVLGDIIEVFEDAGIVLLTVVERDSVDAAVELEFL